MISARTARIDDNLGRGIDGSNPLSLQRGVGCERDFRKQIPSIAVAGTQGIVAAANRERLYASSLVTADATVRAMLAVSPDQITLVGRERICTVRQIIDRRRLFEQVRAIVIGGICPA
jgi:hypothetical protein